MDYDRMDIDPTARIARNAVVIGDVALGADCTVLFNATLRGDCRGRIIVGERTNIQELACIHVPLDGETIVGSDVSVGHGAILHGCVIGDGTLVGMGATVLDGARVGRRCLIGAGALVTGSADIPDGMLVVGSPARVRRALTDEELDGLRINAEEYVAIGRDLVACGLLAEGAVPNAGC